MTNGTFLNGRIHIGEVNFEGGRIGEQSAKYLSDKMKGEGFETDKLKTGTPMRVVAKSIDFSKLQEQKGDENPAQFSFIYKREQPLVQSSCFLAYTNLKVHDILRTGFASSPMFNGRIQGKGPRYCPSIEDKIERFSDKDRHQLFIEPESKFTDLYYINGFSSSLPLEIQYEALHNIEGFERAVIQKPGYAIEYDYFPPTQLIDTLETKIVSRLYFAGQINGTTGYEEAACQGLIAGINAHLKIREQEPFVIKRSEAQPYLATTVNIACLALTDWTSLPFLSTTTSASTMATFQNLSKPQTTKKHAEHSLSATTVLCQSSGRQTTALAATNAIRIAHKESTFHAS